MRTQTLIALAGVAALAVSASPATAAPRKPVTKTYTATAPTPDPSNAADSTPYPVCPQNVPQSFHVETFKAPGVGKLAVEVTGFQGDWDLLVVDGAKGSMLGSSGNGGYGTPATASVEKVTVKVKKAGTAIKIIACNWAGTPTSTVKYTFTYA